MAENSKKNSGKKITGLAALILAVLCAVFGVTYSRNKADPPAGTAAPAQTTEAGAQEDEPQTGAPSETEAPVGETAAADPIVSKAAASGLTFSSRQNLEDHYKKHGIEMGFSSAAAYLAAANAVVANPKALHKLEAEDNDHIYYLEETNEIVFVSQKGFIRTYFEPDRGRAYFDKQ